MSKSFSSSTIFTIFVSALTSIVVFVGLSLVQALPLRGGLAARLGRPMDVSRSSTNTLQIPTDHLAEAWDADRATIEVVQKVQPSVVAILVTGPSRLLQQPDAVTFPFDPFNLEPIPPRIPRSQNGSVQPTQIAGGSGFFVSADGIVVTNKHVVDFDGAIYTVLTADGKKMPAKVLSMDPSHDLAFLKVEGEGLPFLTVGDSDTLVPGQTVIAIGNALDEFRNTVTRGVVSGLNRSVVAGDEMGSELIEEAIQTDAAINPGNSGGPLLDLHGNVIGMNTAMSERGQSLGFALPSNLIARDVASLRKNGRIIRPFLGVRYRMIDEELVRKNQLNVDHGALVLRGTQPGDLAVMPGSPADKAGMVENDIILEVNGESINDTHSLSSIVGHFSPGDQVNVKLLHAGVTKTVGVTLVELKPQTP